MTRRFSSRELSFLRNAIPMEQLVVSFLSLQHHRDSGKLRFACPVCKGFGTSIQAETNLARCFSCKRNFNPIEMVMVHLKLSFVESVNWLKNRNALGINEIPAAQRKAQGSPSSIGEILCGILPSQPPTSPETRSSTIPERIATLEKKVEKLFALIEALTSSPRQ
jgi:hypothetical protein